MRGRAVFALLVALLLLLLPTLVRADTGCECPEDTQLAARFEWDEDVEIYVFEKPEGNENVATIVGDETGGTWTSTVPIMAVVIKGATNCHTYSFDPTTIDGSFTKEDLPLNEGGQRSDVSNIQLCESKPTAVTLSGLGASTSRPTMSVNTLATLLALASLVLAALVLVGGVLGLTRKRLW